MWSPETRRVVALTVLGCVALTSCITGQRPSFNDDEPTREATGSSEVDAVLDRLDSVTGSRGTAEYEISGANGDSENATVVLAGGGRTSVTVGDTRYLIEGGEGITCNLATAECEASLNDARISNLQLTHEFYAPAFAQRLRVDAARRIQDPTGYTETVGGKKALCVRIPVTGGEKTYCALDSGLLARYEGPDTTIELVSYRRRPDETQFGSGA